MFSRPTIYILKPLHLGLLAKILFNRGNIIFAESPVTRLQM